MTDEVNRRDFLNKLGVTVGVAAGAGAGIAASNLVPLGEARADAPKGSIPDKPFRTGHMTFLTGPAAVLGQPSLRGHTLAAEEINGQGGLLGKRKIETVTTDEAAGVDAAVKEMRRLKLTENIDLFTGVISSGTSPALGPVAEELGLLTLLTDGCTDFLFDKAVPKPRYLFRVTNIQSADGITAAVGVAQTWPQVKKIAHLHPDYAYGHNAEEHFSLAIERLLPGTEKVAVAWPKLFTTDFTPHITKLLAAQPDLLFSSVWGGDYVAFYKQALRYGLFDKMKFASTIAFGIAPHAIGADHPEGVLVGVHANYHFTYPGGERWPPNQDFVQRYYKRWKEYPNFEAEGAYTSLQVYKSAVERANRLVGGWPDDEAIISQIEGLGLDTPAGYLYIRPDNHQGYKDTVIGFAKKVAQYPFPILDPERIITIPVRNISAPANWPKPGTTHHETTAAADWIKKTWPSVKA